MGALTEAPPLALQTKEEMMFLELMIPADELFAEPDEFGADRLDGRAKLRQVRNTRTRPRERFRDQPVFTFQNFKNVEGHQFLPTTAVFRCRAAGPYTGQG